VIEHPEYRYVEGIAYSERTGGLPFWHAWAVTPEGLVVDNTWPYAAGNRYFGVAYDRAKYLKYLRAQKFYGVLGGGRKAAAKILETGAGDLRWVAPRELEVVGRGELPAWVAERRAQEAPTQRLVVRSPSAVTTEKYDKIVERFQADYGIKVDTFTSGWSGAPKGDLDMKHQWFIKHAPAIEEALKDAQKGFGLGFDYPIAKIELQTSAERELAGRAAGGMATWIPGPGRGAGTPFSGTMSVNASYRDMARAAKLGGQGGWWATWDPAAVYRHELVHAVHAARAPQLFAGRASALRVWKLKTEWEVAERVSAYAATDPAEFVAELGSALLKGKHYDAEVMRLYKKYKGPLPKGTT